MFAIIMGSAMGTTLAIVAILAGWMACDWWFDAKAVDRDYPDEPQEIGHSQEEFP